MFKKLANWLSEDSAKGKTSSSTKKKSPAPKTPKVESSPQTEDPGSLIRQAIMEAEKTMAMEEKIAGHDQDHLEAVRGAMMIYRQKQENLDQLPLREKARLRALGEALFGDELSKAEKKAKKTH